MSRSIFEPRINVMPYEYPELLKFKDAIRHSYWLHTEFNITGDVQDFKTKMTDAEVNLAKNCMLSIAQIEVAVKRFWGNLYTYFPKPEIDDVGGTFAESEVRHKDAYAFLLQIMGLDEEFKNVHNIPAVIDRVNYLEKAMDRGKSKLDVTTKLILFSLLVEHTALFSQLYILMSFNKRKNMLKGMSNIVEATSKEEEIHGRFGITLYSIIKEECPELDNSNIVTEINRVVKKALKAEEKILDWLFEKGDLEFINREEVYEFIKDRFNRSLVSLGFEKLFQTNREILDKTEWFNEEILSTKENDFFYKRSVDYSKKNVNITEDDLF